MIEIKRYTIDLGKRADEVMIHEKLLGFDFPITRRAAENFNSHAADTEAIVNIQKTTTNYKSYADRLLSEIKAFAEATALEIEA